MKEFFLNYYPRFKCVAGDCKHTCCAGWEMCIDEQTLNDYKNNASDFSKSLDSGIDFKRSKFKADKSGRCAFLNDKGLCEIIINLGEQSLCQVCRDHPRFRSFLDDRIETGLGFSCEQATKIILSQKEKIEPILLSDDKKDEELSFIQQRVLDFRQSILNLVQDRKVDIQERIDNLLSLCNANFSEKRLNKLLKIFISFERLDKGWGLKLKNFKKKPCSLKTAPKYSIYCEQFLANSLYRHLLGAEDVMSARARAVACVFAWWIVKGVFENEQQQSNLDEFELICDVVRAYSSEVEYSQKNLDKLFAFAFKFVSV